MAAKRRPCPCGKGSDPWWLQDYQGIALCLVCHECVEEAKTRYNPWVFTGYDQAFLDEYSGERIEPEF